MLRTLVEPGLDAIRRYWRPFLMLQSLALLLVVGYYRSPAIHQACERLSTMKQESGLLFSGISAAIAGALLPELAKAVMLGDRRVHRQRLRNVAFAVAAFALSGMITDLQYRGIGWIFGNDNHLSTIVKKVLFDQFITTPLYGTPYWLVVYALRANRYGVWTTARQLSPRWYGRTVLPLLITGWAYWFPMCSLIYALPGPLQLCLFCFALAAWSLLTVFIATRQTAV